MLVLTPPGDERYLAAIEEYFKQRMANARKLLELSEAGPQNFTFEVLLLCCCALDAIGNLFLSDDQGEDEGKDKERFHELLWRYGERDGFKFDRVNMVALRKKIDHYRAKSRIDFPKVRSYVESEIARHEYEVGNAVDLDLPFGEVEQITRGLLKEDSGMDRWGWLSNTIRNCTHAGVLYEEYRCGAVHKMLISGHWTSRGRSDEKPFYMPVVGEGVDFTFPESFLIELVERVLVCILYEHISPP